MSTLLKDLNLAEMNVSQLRSAISERYTEAKAIEDRHEHGLTQDANAEDYAEVKRLLSELDTMEDKLAPLEDAEARKARIGANVTAYTQPTSRHPQPTQTERWEAPESPGDQFVKSQHFQDLLQSGILNNPRNQIPHIVVPMEKTNFLAGIQKKALVYSGSAVGGSLVTNDVRPGILDILTRAIVVMDLVPQVPTQSDTIEYGLESTYTNNAAFTAEATATTGTSGTKPESALAYSVQTQAVKTLAHWIPVTNRMLSDASQLRGLINQRLLLGLDLALETQVISGDGTGENLTGILNTAGVLIQGMGADNPMDALYKGRTQVMVTGLARPSAYVLHPNDLQAIRLARENAATATLGAYLMGPPMMTGPTTLWGLPVVESLGITENTGLIGDWQMGLTLFDREQSQLRVGTINDQFVRNMQTILAELRCALVVWRPTAFCRVTGI